MIEDNREVVELPELAKDTKTFAHLIERTASSVADYYGKAEHKADFAVLNDVLFRAAVQFPPEAFVSQDKYWDAYGRLCKKIMEVLGAQGVSAENRTHFYEEELDKLGGSTYQLAKVVRRGREKNPEWRYATSPYLDVRYGIDLMRAWPVWNPAGNSLEIFLTVYQAKASRIGLKPEQVRAAAEGYAEKAGWVRQNLEFDPDWVSSRILDQTDAYTLRNIEMATNDLARARNILSAMSVDQGTAFERWRAAYVRGLMVERFSEALGAPSGSSMPVVKQRGAEVSFRFIVDTAKGLEDLTAEQALQYGKAA